MNSIKHDTSRPVVVENVVTDVPTVGKVLETAMVARNYPGRKLPVSHKVQEQLMESMFIIPLSRPVELTWKGLKSSRSANIMLAL